MGGHGQQCVQTGDAHQPALFEVGEQAVSPPHGLGVAGHALGAAIPSFGHEPGSFEEPLTEQTPLRGRKPNPKTQYQRLAAVVVKEQRRDRRRARLSHSL